MKTIARMILGVLLAVTAHADDVVKEDGRGGINWTKGVVYAHGYGVAPDDAPDRKKRLLARRAAQVDAYRNLAEIIQGVRVTSETVVQDLTLASDTVKTKVDGLIRGAVMTADHYQNDIAEVTMEIPIDNGLAPITNSAEKVLQSASVTTFEQFQTQLEALAAMIGPARAEAASRLITSAQELEFAQRLLAQTESVNLQELLQREIASYGDLSEFTGLLIDAREVTQFELATIPRIRKSDGTIIYPRNELFHGTLAAKRPVSYDFDVNDAINNDRVAINPYVIRANGTFKSRQSDLVIDDDVAAQITANTGLMNIINAAGVMIVVSP